MLSCYYNDSINKHRESMQFQSESLNTVVDYYEVKYFIPYGTEVSKNVRLKVVTYKGKTFESSTYQRIRYGGGDRHFT